MTNRPTKPVEPPFDALPAVDAATRERLHARLVSEAERDGILDVAYRTVDTPAGGLVLAATDQGLVRVAYVHDGPELVLQELADVVSPRVVESPRRLDEVSRELDEYFGGRRTAFDVRLDLRLATGFRRSVLSHLPEIAYGRTESYAEVAAAIGSPRAFRAVGTACARNPLPIVLPCHRVVRSDGSIGEYAGGAGAKHVLLDLEAA